MLGVCLILLVACRLNITVRPSVLMVGRLLLLRPVSRAEWNRMPSCIIDFRFVGVFFILCRPGISERLTWCGAYLADRLTIRLRRYALDVSVGRASLASLD